MMLYILDPHDQVFARVCAEFAVTPDLVNQQTVVAMPALRTQMTQYSIPDDSPMATWVALNHPEWITELWRQVNNYLNPESTHGQHR